MSPFLESDKSFRHKIKIKVANKEKEGSSKGMSLFTCSDG